MEAMGSGVPFTEVGERLLDRIHITLDRVHSGESTARRAEDGDEEFWPARATEFGLEVADPDKDEPYGRTRSGSLSGTSFTVYPTGAARQQ